MKRGLRHFRAVRCFASPLFLVLFIGCDGAGDLLTYTFDVDNEITVPGKDIVAVNPLVSDEVFPADFGALLASELEQSFSTEGVDPNSVSSLQLTKMTIEVTEPEENGRVVRHLEFLDSMSFAIGAGDLEAVEVAYSEEDAFVGEVTTYDFVVTEAELADYLSEDNEIQMATEFATDPPPGDRPNFDTTIRFTATIQVKADPVGALF